MSKRKRKNRSALTGIKRRLQRRYVSDSKTVKASNFIHPLKEYFKQHPNMIVILYNRESSRSQDDNHVTNERVLRNRCKKLGIPVINFYSETISGKILNEDRKGLLQAVSKARAKIKKGKHAVILAVSTDRVLRNEYFTTNYPDITPTEKEYEQLKKLTCNVPLATLLHPDMPPNKVRGKQTRWGQKVKKSKVGQPKKPRPGYFKKRRFEKLSQVLDLRKRYFSYREIEKMTSIPKTTASDWIKKYG